MTLQDDRALAARMSASFKDGVQAARDVVAMEQAKFGAAPILGFSRWQFFLGTTKTYVTVFVFAKFPQHFWAWHLVQFALLLPLQAYRWAHPKMRGLAYFAEFCCTQPLPAEAECTHLAARVTVDSPSS